MAPTNCQGETEAALAAMGFERFSTARPGGILGRAGSASLGVIDSVFNNYLPFLVHTPMAVHRDDIAKVW